MDVEWQSLEQKFYYSFVHKLFHQIFPLNLFFSFPSSEPERRLGGQQHRRPDDHQKVKGQDWSGGTEAAVAMFTGTSEKQQKTEQWRVYYISPLLLFLFYYHLFCQKLKMFQSIFGNRTMVQNVEFFKGSLVQKETSDTQLKEMLRNVINSNEQFSFYYYFLVIWDIQSEEV